MKPATFSQDGYRWMTKTIDGLDPETEYEAIWRISFIVTPNGAELAWRDDGGKVVNSAANRAEATVHYNMTWWNYGPSDERCQAAVERINKLHGRLARQYPGRFSDNIEYIYTLCFSAIVMHRFQLRLGQPGFTPKQKIAAHHFWRDMAELFTVENQGKVRGFPDSFEACVEMCETYEAVPRPSNPRSRAPALAIFHYFAYRYFPPGLRWLGFAFPRTLIVPATLRSHGIEPPHPLVAGLVFFLTKLIFFVLKLVPDPKVPFVEKIDNLPEAEKRNRKEHIVALDKGFAKYFEENNLSGMSCPYVAKVK
ncbi:oxygenase MpaB family protein [Microdochium nivale]|nr:oxygenase MpaB family protein [Microdochium nivale]